MDIEDAIYGRRSIRNFTEEKIPMDVLKKIIHAGTYAPSACNFQAWKFIVINDEDVKNKIVSGGVVRYNQEISSRYSGCIS